MKVLFLIFGVAVGFGAGVWWGVHHPDQAQQLSAAEERRFLEAQMKVTKATKDQLDRIIASHSGGASTPGSGFSGFVGSSPLPSVDTAAVTKLSNDQQQQLDDLQKHLDSLKDK